MLHTRAPTRQISESTTIAEKEKQKVAVIVDSVTKKAGEIAAVKDDAERDLAAAKPALDAALSALNSISPKDITSLKALKNPPDIIKRIFDCVLLLRYWCVLGLRGCMPGPAMCWAVHALASGAFAGLQRYKQLQLWHAAHL